MTTPPEATNLPLPPRRRLLASAVLPALALAAVLLPSAGCSADKHTFYSTTTAPKSVDVRYVESGQTAWSKDIPEGHELTLNFNRPGEGLFRSMPKTPATKMKWKLKQVSAGSDDRGRPTDDRQNDSGTVDLDGLPIQMDVRVDVDAAG
ncbi:hypothetical protein [Phycisphaera mikurensis]|uniref:Uncharacterized protein n=1 Tax=Phycisphaera mikurensis (strain NBRC 102666 / KCTC 22515 / FYK2301M01) TaxID=1142394 RepID=I0IJB9_PHYMF|nr:hypothetical protein [Phycisphaera mikurensis]MBB6441844.1 hypothetical protein [Phycisphaera mikurensis]BAM05357.1 hypothetical protein PSMK_31980 [Phycisphaera mikurensis NBRC 102666]